MSLQGIEELLNKLLEQINIQDIVKIAKEAGKSIMQIYNQNFDVEYKKDKSPLTYADKQSNDIINKGLNDLPIKFPILSEEGRDILYQDRKNWDYLWIVDPLDGTKEFIKKNPKSFLLLFFLLVAEGMVAASSVLAVIPLADFLFDSTLKDPSKVTLFIQDKFLLFGIPINFWSFGIFFASLNFINGPSDI